MNPVVTVRDERWATEGPLAVLPAEQEAANFQHYGLSYQPGAEGERQLARR